MKVNLKLGVFLQLLVKALLIVVRELERELSPKHREHMKQQIAQSQEQHGGKRERAAENSR